jgi:phosphocarrier protein HPr
MHQRRTIVGSRVGLHARPAATFARAAEQTGIPVTIAAGDQAPVPAASMLSVMTLGVKFGEEVVLAADGPGAEEALDVLAVLLESDLDAG